MVVRTPKAKITRLRNHSAFAVPYRTAFAELLLLNVVAKMLQAYLLPEQPVLIMPPIVAPGAGSSLQCKAQSRCTFSQKLCRSSYRKEKRNPCISFSETPSSIVNLMELLTFLFELVIYISPTRAGLADQVHICSYSIQVTMVFIQEHSRLLTIDLQDAIHS